MGATASESCLAVQGGSTFWKQRGNDRFKAWAIKG